MDGVVVVRRASRPFKSTSTSTSTGPVTKVAQSSCVRRRAPGMGKKLGEARRARDKGRNGRRQDVWRGGDAVGCSGCRDGLAALRGRQEARRQIAWLPRHLIVRKVNQLKKKRRLASDHLLGPTPLPRRTRATWLGRPSQPLHALFPRRLWAAAPRGVRSARGHDACASCFLPLQCLG